MYCLRREQKEQNKQVNQHANRSQSERSKNDWLCFVAIVTAQIGCEFRVWNERQQCAKNTAGKIELENWLDLGARRPVWACVRVCVCVKESVYYVRSSSISIPMNSSSSPKIRSIQFVLFFERHVGNMALAHIASSFLFVCITLLFDVSIYVRWNKHSIFFRVCFFFQRAKIQFRKAFTVRDDAT